MDVLIFCVTGMGGVRRCAPVGQLVVLDVYVNVAVFLFHAFSIAKFEFSLRVARRL